MFGTKEILDGTKGIFVCRFGYRLADGADCSGVYLQILAAELETYGECEDSPQSQVACWQDLHLN